MRVNFDEINSLAWSLKLESCGDGLEFQSPAKENQVIFRIETLNTGQSGTHYRLTALHAADLQPRPLFNWARLSQAFQTVAERTRREELATTVHFDENGRLNFILMTTDPSLTAYLLRLVAATVLQTVIR